MKTYNYSAWYGTQIVDLADDFDLDEDYLVNRSHKAILEDGRVVRVIIDHHATGTGTGGEGDTVVRSIPRGWRSEK